MIANIYVFFNTVFQQFVVSSLTTLSENVFQIKRQVDYILKRPTLVYEDSDFELCVQLPVDTVSRLSRLNQEVIDEAQAREALVRTNVIQIVL